MMLKDDAEMVKSLDEALVDLSVREDVKDVRTDQQEKMLMRFGSLAGQGTLLAYFASIQTVFLTLKWTGDIQWSWWFIPLPTLILSAIWYIINWSRKEQANRMITEMKRDINEIKRHIQEDIRE